MNFFNNIAHNLLHGYSSGAFSRQWNRDQYQWSMAHILLLSNIAQILVHIPLSTHIPLILASIPLLSHIPRQNVHILLSGRIQTSHSYVFKYCIEGQPIGIRYVIKKLILFLGSSRIWIKPHEGCKFDNLLPFTTPKKVLLLLINQKLAQAFIWLLFSVIQTISPRNIRR